MGERKNIDRLFQEQFKDFEQAPDSMVWENIEQELLKELPEKKKKPIPFFFKWIGFAASILLLISIGIIVLNSNNKPDTIIVKDNSINSSIENQNKNLVDKNNSNKNLLKTKGEQSVTSTENNPSSINGSSDNDQIVPLNKRQETNINNEIVTYPTNVKNKTLNKSNGSSKSSIQKGIVIANNNTKTDYGNITNSNNSNKFNKKGNLDNRNILVINSKNSGSIIQKDKKITNEKKSNHLNKSLESSTISDNNTNESLAENKNNQSDNNNIEILVKKDLGNKKNTQTLNGVDESNTLALNEKDLAIKENTEDQAQEEEELPSIEEAIAEQKEKKDEELNNEEEKTPFNRWKIQPNIAPVYYNSLSSGSPIDSQFKSNKKKGAVNMSYGINFSYALNRKLKIRSGINKLELGYSTENVAVVPFEAGEGSIKPLKNISPVSGGENLNVSSANGFTVSQIPSSFQNLFDSSLDQKFGYLEVPLELAYRLTENKLSINLISGMSTFFLTNNEIYATTNSYTTLLGEANNLNKTVFSANLGVGFNYNISNKFSLNVEPTFKYQLNSFSNDAGNFKPYLLGVYSGLSFKF